MIATQEQRGFLWPASDGHGHGVIADSVADLEHVIPLCDQKRVAVQAGGNVGVWARRLAADFETVYTFEPDHENFACLAANVIEPNVIKLQAALGSNGVPVSLIRANHNCGGHAIDESAGNIPVLRIDDLNLQACDLIYLDVEGYELHAVHGATKTIRAHRPLIAFEDKGLSVAYGVKQGELAEWLRDAFHYERIASIGNDIVCRCSL